jgi:hypothetical protein
MWGVSSYLHSGDVHAHGSDVGIHQEGETHSDEHGNEHADEHAHEHSHEGDQSK